MSTIELTRSGDEWRAVDTETGLEAAGDTRGHALRTLGTLLDAGLTNEESAERLTELAADTQARFEDADIDESVVENAIEWARS